MSSSTNRDPPPRLRSPIPIVLQGDLGLVEGEIWAIDDVSLVLWCPERVTDAEPHGARADLGPLGQADQLQLRIRPQQPDPLPRARGGYLLDATWSLRDPGARANLQARIAQLWGQAGTCPFDRDGRLASVARSRPSPSIARSSTDPGAVVRSSRPQAPHQEERTDPLTSPPRSRPRGSAPSQIQRPAPANRSGEPLISFAAQPAPAMMVAWSSRDTFRQQLRLLGDLLEVTLPESPSLPWNQGLTLLLRLPSGLTIQLEAVAAPHALGARLTGRLSDRALLAMLHSMLS